MKKTAVFLLIALVALSPVFASVTRGTEDLYYIETEHFRIICKPGSAQTAQLVYENIEQIYAEVKTNLDALWGRAYTDLKAMPVVITDEIDVLNAYYTSYPYNRIVLYDTTGPVDELSNFNDGILSTLRHEMTHAVQLNLKTEFYNKYASIFADMISPQARYLNTMLLEGTAVFSESLSGYGRLNDNSAMQLLTEAKLEDVLLPLIQATGVKDTGRAGDIPYIFGAGFIQFLYDNWGLEKLQEFFEYTGETNILDNAKTLFADTYGLTMVEAWDAYKDSIEVPENVKTPTAIDLKIGDYSSLTVNGGSLYAVDFDSDRIVKAGENGLETKLVYLSTYPSLSFTSEGNMLVEVNNGALIGQIRLLSPDGTPLCIFDGYRDAVAAYSGDNEVYCLYRCAGQSTFIDVYSGDNELLKTVELPYASNSDFFCDAGNSTLAFITSINGVERIGLFNLESGELKYISNPGSILIRSLSAKDGILSFSWFPRERAAVLACYGEIDLQRMQMRLSKDQYLGGINEPVLSDGAIMYVAEYFEGDYLCTVSADALTFADPVSLTAETVETGDAPDIYILSQSRPYTFDDGMFTDMLQGIIFPLYAEGDRYSGLGATFLTADPTETWEATAAAGWDFGRRALFMSLDVVNTAIDNLPIEGRIELGTDLSMDIYGAATTTWYLRNSCERVGAGVSADIYLSRGYSSLRLSGSGTYSYLVHHSPQVFDYDGFKASASLTMYLSRYSSLYFNASARYYLPRFDEEMQKEVLASIYGTASVSASPGRFAIGLEGGTIAFTREIQQGIEAINIYFNRVVVNPYLHTSLVLNDFSASSVNIGTDAYVVVSPVWGMLTGTQFKLGFSFDWPIGYVPTFTLLIDSDL